MGVEGALTTRVLHAEPGAEAVTTVRIRNTGTVVDHFHVDVLGDAAGWATATPPVLPLFPGAEGVVTVTFSPARGPTARAGVVSFAVRIASEADPRAATVEEGTIEIGAFTQVAAEISPEISHARSVGRHQIACDNFGNAPVTLAFKGGDPENALRFKFRPPNPVGQPGTATIVRMGVRAPHRFLTGRPRTYRFQAVVQAQSAPPITLSGSMVQAPLIARWLLVGLALLVVAGAVGAAVVFGLYPSLANKPAPAPTSTPTSGSSPTPSPSASPSVAPSPTPTAATSGLTAPQQVSPPSGTVFSTFPRTTTLEWTPLPGAASYDVQIDSYSPGDTTCASGSAFPLVTGVTGNSYTFNFVGAQPGCWQVLAVDNNGNAGPPSPLWEFSYTE